MCCNVRSTIGVCLLRHRSWRRQGPRSDARRGPPVDAADTRFEAVGCRFVALELVTDRHMGRAVATTLSSIRADVSRRVDLPSRSATDRRVLVGVDPSRQFAPAPARMRFRRQRSIIMTPDGAPPAMASRAERPRSDRIGQVDAVPSSAGAEA
jgi:hypothetical protein